MGPIGPASKVSIVTSKAGEKSYLGHSVSARDIEISYIKI